MNNLGRKSQKSTVFHTSGWNILILLFNGGFWCFKVSPILKLQIDREDIREYKGDTWRRGGYHFSEHCLSWHDPCKGNLKGKYGRLKLSGKWNYCVYGNHNMHVTLERYKMHHHKSMFGVFYKYLWGFRKIQSFSFLVPVTFKIVKISFPEKKKVNHDIYRNAYVFR